jgi:hypothetical protein
MSLENQWRRSMKQDRAYAAETLNTLQRCGLITAREVDVVDRLIGAGSLFADAVDLAETVHLHIKVDDTHQLPVNEFFDAGARLDHQKDGFVKYRFRGGINGIFSHIRISQDDVLETERNRQPRPFLDHIGIDLRDEVAPVRAVFDSLPARASGLGWSLASQGGPDRAVYCCHVEVAEKRWLYPPGEHGHRGIPLEFAYGALRMNPETSGCDLRPVDPSKADPAAVPCCGAPQQKEAATAGACATTAQCR